MPEDKGCNSESSNVIKVPSYLSKTMKEWAEATIRTQPSDLCRWSAFYFRMKANGERPPVKPYLDVRDLELGPGGLTANILKVLATSLSNEFESSEKIENMWSILSLEKSVYFEIIDAGNFKAHIKSIEFIGIAAAFLNTRLRDTMVLLCDTLSDEYSIGILLDTFVTVYTYLARLSGTYVVSSRRVPRKEDDRADNVDGILSGDSDSECFKSSDSEEDSDVDDEPGAVDCAATGWSDGYAVTKSDEGIMKYQNDDRYAADLDLDRPTAIRPPMNTCEDPDQLFAFREMKPNTYDDELLSLLSGSSTISDHDLSVISFGWSDGDVAGGTAAAADQQSAEQLHGGGEETMSGTFAVPEDMSGDDEYDPTDGSSAAAAAAAVSNDRNDECNETNAYDDYDDVDAEAHDYAAVPVNTDYIVMLALVDGPQPQPEPQPEPSLVVTREDDNGSEHDEPLAENESAESVFSLLEHSGLVAGAAGTEHTAAAADDDDTGDQPRGQTFDETDHYTAADGDSSSGDGEPGSDVTPEFQYSEIDQQSVESGPPPDVWSTVDDAMAVAEAGARDDAAYLPHDEDNGYEQFDVDGYDETERNDEFACGECETHSYGQNASAESAEEHVDRAGETLEPQVVRVVKTLPGVGPPLPDHQIQRVIDWLTKCARIQNNHVLERNLLHYLCPPLDHHHHHD